MSAGQERSGEPHLKQEACQRQAPALTLRKDGSAIRSIGENSRRVDIGSASVSAPNSTRLWRADFGPALSMSYDSLAGNGPCGLGWTLSQPAITRKTDPGLPRYGDWNESDVFILFGAGDLVPELGVNGARLEDATSGPGYRIYRYRPRIEGAFARVARWTHRENPGDPHWRVAFRDNVLPIRPFRKTRRSEHGDPLDRKNGRIPRSQGRRRPRREDELARPAACDGFSPRD